MVNFEKIAEGLSEKLFEKAKSPRVVRTILQTEKKVILDLRRRETIPERKLHFREEGIGTRSNLFA